MRFTSIYIYFQLQTFIDTNVIAVNDFVLSGFRPRISAPLIPVTSFAPSFFDAQARRFARVALRRIWRTHTGRE
jgi:hypothetical protein